METRLSRRFFLAGGSAAALAVGAPAWGKAPDASLRPVLRDPEARRKQVAEADDIIADANLTGEVAFAVASAETGKWLEARNEHQGAPPASVAKALTALYALDTLGRDHRFETQIYGTGALVEGELQGDLVLVGGGDPTLDSDGLADLVIRLKGAGVLSVKGGFKVYEHALPVMRQIDPQQPDQVGYNPAVSGIALNYNRVHFEWKRANGDYAVTMEGRAARYQPAVAMATMQIVDRSAPVYTYEDRDNRDRWTVARGALGKEGARWLPVRRPGLYAGEAFATIALSQGIKLGTPEMIDTLPEGGSTLARRESEPLYDILEGMLRYSNNLTAEMVGLSASVKRSDDIANLRASAAEMNRWAMAELGMQSPALVDHSGLGDDSMVSASDMARALVKAKDAGLRPILKDFLLRDSRGRPERDHPTKVAAKTGTLNFVSGLAGYITAPDGTELTFAIFVADLPRRDAIPREERERPPGARHWNGRAKMLQSALIKRWGVVYGT